MNQILPKITVVTPSFNQGQYLEKTIASVLEQNYSNLEYIIVDGGSRDQSVEIIKKYAKHLAYWTSEPDHGQADAINKGFRRGTGDLLAWINSDDYYLPGALHHFAEAAVARPGDSVFVGAGDWVNVQGEVVHQLKPNSQITLESLYNWLDRGDFCQPSCAFRRHAWETAGPLDHNVHIALDLDLWLKMAKSGCRFGVIDGTLSHTLIHAGAKTTAFEQLTRVDAAIVILKHGGEPAVRPYLEELACRVAWAEANLSKILDHPIVKLLTPILSILVKPAARRSELRPRWLADNSNKQKA